MAEMDGSGMRKTAAMLAALALSVTAVLAQNDLTISELLYQPKSGEAEYVELYNNGSQPVELADYHIVRWVGDSLGKHYALPQLTVPARGYVVLTKDAASVEANYDVARRELLVECALPTYPNDGGSVVLATGDSVVVDRLDYSPSMHSRLLRNKAGVALERRSFERQTNDPANWFSAASTAGYGTPTGPNSQSTEWLAEEVSFTLSSTLLSPDGDGYQDAVVMEYTLEEGDLMASMLIYDATGRKVRRLVNNALLGTHGSVEWDGRDDGGKQVPRGRYVLDITLYGLHGTQQTMRRTISVVNR